MRIRWLIGAAFAVSLVIPVSALARPAEPPGEYDKTDNMRFSGFSERQGGGSLSESNSDLAFQGGARTRARSRASASSTSATSRSPSNSSTTRTAVTPRGRGTS